MGIILHMSSALTWCIYQINIYMYICINCLIYVNFRNEIIIDGQAHMWRLGNPTVSKTDMIPLNDTVYILAEGD